MDASFIAGVVTTVFFLGFGYFIYTKVTKKKLKFTSAASGSSKATKIK